MHTEVPILTRCCCCFPLRRGLIAWGYIKLTISILLTFFTITTLYVVACYAMMSTSVAINYYFGLLLILLIMTIGDVVLHVIFLVGAHKKEVKLLKVYYYYSLTILILSAVFGAIGLCFIMARFVNEFNEYVLTLLVSDFSTLFTSLVLQAYIVLLVKSEIYKLNNMGSFKFVNHAAEAQCTLYVGQPCKKEWEDRIYIEDGKEIDNKYLENLVRVHNI